MRRLALVLVLALAPVAARAKPIPTPFSLAEANKLAQEISFKPTIDALTLSELNAIIMQSSARKRIREGLVRMETFREVVERELTAQSVPLAMAAIPLVESSYQNLPDLDRKGQCCAGLWQLRKDTARVFGLKVTKKIDERREVAKSTAAAAKLLAANYSDHGDWTLAIAAYQAGSKGLADAIAKARTKDLGKLIRGRHLSRYTPKVLATMIIAHHPDLVSY